MKKILLCSIVAVSATFGYSQTNKVVTAYNYHRYYMTDKKAEDIINAKANIDEATNHEATMGKAKTWNYRGNIYLAIGESKDEKVKALHPNALDEAAKAFQKSIQLDGGNEFTTNPPAANFLSNNMGLNRAGYLSLNKGVDNFTAKAYEQALTNFETSIEINKFFKKTDTMGIYNAALAAEKIENFGKASEYFGQLIVLKHGGADMYHFQSRNYKKMKDDEKAQAVIQAGRQAYPDDKNLIIEELNYYLAAGKTNEAVNNLTLAVEKDPTNPLLHFSLGSMYDALANPEKGKPVPTDAQYLDYLTKAEASYKKALELKPDYFDPMYNLGALYFNQGVKLNEGANSITDNAKYAKEVKKADEKFTVALPYLEKALELQPNDRNTLLSLKQLYARTNQSEKYNKVSEQLKN